LKLEIFNLDCMAGRKVILNEIRDIFLLALAGILMTWSGLTCRNCYSSTRGFWVIASFTALVWVFLWKGNSYLGDYISTKISWLKFPVKRFIVGLIGTMIYTLMVMYLLGMVYTLSFHVNFSSGLIYSAIITVVISLFMHSRAFLFHWKQTSIDAERLQKENIAARYESLNNQVSPHFLFNSLNALTNLVYEDQDKAVKFIKQLSEVYRYVLDTRAREVVPLEEELRFLHSYIFLQQIRFGSKLDIHFDLDHVKSSVAPLALQMLIENAIKHNIVSEEDPLHVKVYADEHYIIVENNIQKKDFLAEPSAGVGLENICKRYDFLSDRKAEVIKDEKLFIVKLPRLKETQS
jgi:sensor histidine kinase YesM